MKIIGAVMVILSCGLLGIKFYKKCLEENIYIQGLIDGFEYIKNDMSFAPDVLSVICQKASIFSGKAELFFVNIGIEMANDGIAISDAFNKCEKYIKQYSGKKTYTIVKETFLQLGTNNAENQIKMLDSTISKLKTLQKQQKNFCDNEGQICKKLGFIAGVSVVLALF